jgi:glutathione S-transferase
MLTIHHLGVSQSDRIVWLCEELGVPYRLDKYDRDPPGIGGAPDAYKALSPFGTAPVITDGDLVIGESGAIIEYIIHRHGGGRLAVGPEQPNYPDYLYWFHFANASLMSAGMVELAIRRLGVDAGPAQRLLQRGDRAFRMVEARLAQSPYLAGAAFTAADLIMNFPLTTMRLFAPRDISPYPHLRAYLARIAERPAYQRALAAADPELTPKID